MGTHGGEGGGQGSERGSGETWLPRWRSFSGSKSKSVKIRSSGFICYLDGPERERCASHVPTHKVGESALISSCMQAGWEMAS